MRHLARLTDAVLAMLMAGMGIMVLTNVILRYGFNSGISVSEELSRFFFVWMTFIGAVVASHEATHLNVDSFVNMLPPLGRKICMVLSTALMLCCNALLLHGSWIQSIINLDNKAPITGAPMTVIYATGVLLSIGVSVFLLRDLWRVLFRSAASADRQGQRE